MRPRILVTGARGQVGWELLRACQPLGEVIGLDREGLDLTRPDHIRRVINDWRPDAILNSAAYTAVDQAEREEAQAQAINADAVAVLAERAQAVGALLVHYSTDYVFDGRKADAYVPSDPTCPINAYGRSKLAGEQALAASNADWLCLRTSWVYAARGRNFMRTILKLARERTELRIVSDQIGAPTPARLIADATAHALRQSLAARREGRFERECLHLTAAGETSWHGFASYLIERARANGGGPLAVEALHAIPSSDYPVPAARPANSRLDCSRFEARFDLRLPDWRTGASLCLSELLSLTHAA